MARTAASPKYTDFYLFCTLVFLAATAINRLSKKKGRYLVIGLAAVITVPLILNQRDEIEERTTFPITPVPRLQSLFHTRNLK